MHHSGGCVRGGAAHGVVALWRCGVQALVVLQEET